MRHSPMTSGRTIHSASVVPACAHSVPSMRCSVIGASDEVGSSQCTTVSSPATRPAMAHASGSANWQTMAGADA